MAIWWIRRDLRLADNPALHAALADGLGVTPLYILDPHALQFPAAKRQAFLLAGLRQLDADLRVRGSRLIVREGRPNEVLAALLAETGSNAIYAEEGYSPYARRRDAEVAAHLPLRPAPGRTVHHPADVLTKAGAPHTVFTPFMRAWKTLPLPSVSDLLSAPARLPAVPAELPSSELPDGNLPHNMVPGEAEAQRRLHAFAAPSDAPICAYRESRNRLDLDGTSQLSAYLRFGMISARQAVAAARAAPCASGAETWLSELMWREFYHAVVYHFPNVLQEAMRADRRSIAWSNGYDDFAAWCDGRTGYPIVDAAMRQLVQTGWMHNRARMIVASFLVKDLLVDWQWGERFFMEHLIDGDAAANNGGWQWVAGVGADAAPYFRVFNPVLQARRFDPAGVFVRRWLPELGRVPDAYVHTPWDMPDDAQRAAGCVIGRDYPAPIVDHALARERALAAYRAARSQLLTASARSSS